MPPTQLLPRALGEHGTAAATALATEALSATEKRAPTRQAAGRTGTRPAPAAGQLTI